MVEGPSTALRAVYLSRWLVQGSRALSQAHGALGRTPMGIERVNNERERAWCGDCGAELEVVRPGKFQHIGPCPRCGEEDSAQEDMEDDYEIFGPLATDKG